MSVFCRNYAISATLFTMFFAAGESARGSGFTFSSINNPYIFGTSGTVVGGINNNGEVDGWYTDPSTGLKQGFYIQNGVGWQNYSGSEPGSSTTLKGIDSSVDVVGTVYRANGETEGFYNGALIGYAGGWNLSLDSVNSAGAAVGYVENPSTQADHGFILEADGSTEVTFDVPGAISTEALGLNDAGEIVGTYTDAGGVNHGFLRSADGSAYSTFNDPNGSTWATAINNNGEIVGYYTTASGATSGFTLSSDLQTFTSISPSSGNSEILGVNDLGQIAGWYMDTAGNVQGFVGTPPAAAPEPGTFGLFCFACGAVVWGRKKLGNR